MGMLRPNWKFILQLELHTGYIKRAMVTKVRYGAERFTEG